LQEFAPATMRIPKRILSGIAVGILVVAGANSCNGTSLFALFVNSSYLYEGDLGRMMAHISTGTPFLDFRLKIFHIFVCSMGNIFNPDFQDFIRALNETEVRYVLVGGYAVILHGYNRTTGDLDIWVDRTEENYTRLVSAFRIFKMPVFDMSLENFLNTTQYDVFTFGVPPVSIDIMLHVKGLEFKKALSTAEWKVIDDVNVNLIDLQSLIRAKKASGRHRDLDDIEKIE